MKSRRRWRPYRPAEPEWPDCYALIQVGDVTLAVGSRQEVQRFSGLPDSCGLTPDELEALCDQVARQRGNGALVPHPFPGDMLRTIAAVKLGFPGARVEDFSHHDPRWMAGAPPRGSQDTVWGRAGRDPDGDPTVG